MAKREPWGVKNVETGKVTMAPRFCPTCGREFEEAEVRHIMGTMFEVSCECGVTAVIHQDDHVKF